MTGASRSATLIAISVIEQDGRFLVGRRPPGVPLAGLWEFPGGKIEIGESAAAAAQRECREECGLEIEVDQILSVVEHAYEHGTLKLFFMAARIVGQHHLIKPPFQWVERCELANLAFPAANASLIAMLLQTGT